LVNPDKSGNVAIEEIEIPAEGRIVHLKAYGMVKVFRTVVRDGGAEHWATDDFEMSESLNAKSWRGRVGAYRPITGA
jgi:putative transposase